MQENSCIKHHACTLHTQFNKRKLFSLLLIKVLLQYMPQGALRSQPILEACEPVKEAEANTFTRKGLRQIQKGVGQ